MSHIYKKNRFEGNMQPEPIRSALARIREVGANDPNRVAIVFESESVSYRELHNRSSAVANALLAAKLPKPSRIALLDFNHVRFAEVFFGAQKAGHVLTPINARLAAPEVAWIVNDAEAPVLFVGREHYALVEEIEAQLKNVRHIIALHGEHPRWQSYLEWRDMHPGADPELPLDLDSDIVQLYTSGTTGHPKGVCHSHRTWSAAANAAAHSNPSAFSADCVYLTCLPLFHVAGINPLCFVLSGGGRVVLTRRTDPTEIVVLIERHSITNLILVPALILAILNLPQARRVASVRALSYGASPIAEDVLRRAQELFACPFEHLYGMTENWGVCTVLPPTMHDAGSGKLKSCGKPQRGCEVRVVDANGRDVPTGHVGEIIMRSAWLMRGYWNNPTATAKTIRDGWLWTGDAGYLDGDGYLYIHDRVNDMIKPGSENVYPAEVENALFGHPAIADVAVIGVPDEKWGEAVKAVVVLKPGATLDPADLDRHARMRIAGFKVPRSYEVVNALPRNASGKVLRRQLREQFAGR